MPTKFQMVDRLTKKVTAMNRFRSNSHNDLRTISGGAPGETPGEGELRSLCEFKNLQRGPGDKWDAGVEDWDCPRPVRGSFIGSR